MPNNAPSRPPLTDRQQALYEAMADVLDDVDHGHGRLDDPAQLDYILEAIDAAETEQKGTRP